jgi:hypothetical protein
VGKPEERRPVERPRHRWENNIKIDLQEIAWGSVQWIDLSQDRNRWLEHGIEISDSMTF